MRDQLVHRGPDAAGAYVSPRRARRPRASAACRSSISAPRPSADAERGRLASSRLQRRDLQLPAACATTWWRAGIGSDRAPIPKSSSISTKNRARMHRRSSTACSRSRSGTSASAADAGPRSGWQEAAVLRPRRAPLAFGSEIKAFFASPEFAIDGRSRDGAVLLPARLRPVSRHALPRRPSGAARHGHRRSSADGRTASRRYWQLTFPPARASRRVDRRSPRRRPRCASADDARPSNGG